STSTSSLARRKSSAVGVRRTLLLVAGLVTLGVFGLAFAVDRYGQRDRAKKSPAIVMLGARVLSGGIASGSLRARAEKAAQLYREGVAPLVVFSGGIGVNPPAEAELARQIAISEGIPPGACLVEADSHSTDENARFTAKLLKDRGITEAVLVSDPYHLLRASRYFRR